MRMTASWYRPLGRPNTSSWRATRARWRAPLGIVAVIDLNERGHGARVVPNERVWRCARSRQGQVAARWPSATLDRRSAQRPSKIRSGRGDVAGPIEQGDAAHNTLDSNRPIQVLGRIPRLRSPPVERPQSTFNGRCRPWPCTPQMGGERAYERRLGKDRSARQSRHSIASGNRLHRVSPSEEAQTIPRLRAPHECADAKTEKSFKSAGAPMPQRLMEFRASTNLTSAERIRSAGTK